MQSKVSWFKRGIVTQDLRSVGWIGIIYQIALLFGLPLQLVMMHENDQIPYRYSETHSLFAVLDGFQVLLMFTFPVLLGVVLLRYMHVKVSADFIHSLPAKRSTILNHHLLIGMFLLITPVVITAIFIGIVHGVLELNSYFTVKEIISWTGITILMNVFVFVFTTLIGTVTGISAVQAVLTYIFIIFPFGILMMFYFNVKYFIFGFPFNPNYFGRSIEFFTPIIRMTRIIEIDFSGKEILIYLGLIILFYLLAIVAYNKRHIEGATQAISFSLLKPIFKYGVTFCSMLLGGMYFGEMQRENFGWLLFGYFFGSIIGYVIAEMVLQKTWRIFKSLKWYVIYGAVMAAFGVLLNIDITGFEKKVPIAAEVDRAYFGDDARWFYEENANLAMAEYKDPDKPVKSLKEVDLNFFDEIENIRSIVNLHQHIVKDKNMIHNKQFNKQIAIAYKLNDGSKLVRQYQIPENAYKELLKPIYESQEFRYSTNELLRLKEEITVDKIRINANSVIPKSYETVDSKQINEMITALKTDMLQEPYKEMFSKREAWGNIELLLANNERLHFSWKKSYVHFAEWLKKNNLEEKARVVPEDIDYALVIKNEGYLENPPKMIVVETKDFEELFTNNSNSLRIENLKQLEECLFETTWDQGPTQKYLIAFYFKNIDRPETYGLVDAPSFIEQYFK